VLFPSSKSLGGDRRIVVTGAGVVTALGAGWKINAAGFRAGRTAIRPVTLFDVARQRTKIAAEIDLPTTLPRTRLAEKSLRRINRAGRMLLLAAHEAWTQSGWQAEENLPIILGTTSGEMLLGQDYLEQAINAPRRLKQQATRVAAGA